MTVRRAARIAWIVVAAGFAVLAAVVLGMIVGLGVVPTGGRLASPEYAEPASAADVAIEYPLDETVFPPELPPPTFTWRGGEGGAHHPCEARS
ncbi:MAG: hypothetical protein ABR915_09975, partial [Thermoguttaceae bacterium]